MVINRQRLETALSTIHKDEIGFFWSGHFIDLIGELHVNAFRTAKLSNLQKYLMFLQQDIRNIETISSRLVWQKDLRTQNKLDDVSWMFFGACDIDHFHIELRSVFDYLAKVICIVSDKPGQVPFNSSFEELKNWTAKSDKNAQKIGNDLVQIIHSCEWFSDLREIRDLIVHRGGFTMVFPEKDRILFQVYDKFNNGVLIPEIMFNQDVVDFELYAGLYIGYMIAYLEEISELIYNRLDLKKIGSYTKSYHPGLEIIHHWIYSFCR